MWYDRPAAHTRHAREAGSSVVEFAVISPILFLVLFGMVEFGRVFMVEQCLTNAAREGARVAVLRGATAPQVTARIENYLDSCGIDGESVTITPANLTTTSPDQPVTITVSVPYESIAWLPGSFIGMTGTTLANTSVMRKEGW